MTNTEESVQTADVLTDEQASAALRAVIRGEDPDAISEKVETKPVTAKTSEAPAVEPAEEQPETTKSDSEPENDQQEGKKKESALDKRFAKLTRKQKEAEAEVARLKEELEAVKKSPGPSAATETAKPTVIDAEGRPKPPDPVDEDAFTGTWEELQAAKKAYLKQNEDYLEALSDWKVDQKLKARDAERQKEEANKSDAANQAEFESRVAKYAEKDSDIADAINDIGPLVGRVGLTDMIRTSEVGPEILMHLWANDLAEAKRLAKFGDPLKIAAEVGKIEARLLLEHAPSKSPATAAKIAAHLPKPAQTVGGRGAPENVDLATADYATSKREFFKSLGR